MTGTQLKQRRERLGLSQTALAKRWGVRQATISDWENEKIAIEHPEILEDAMKTLERENGTQSKKQHA